MLDLLSNVYGMLLWWLQQKDLPLAQRYWQIGAHLSEWEIVDIAFFLDALSQLLWERENIRIKRAKWQQIRAVYAAFPKALDYRLSWTHYCILSRVTDSKARAFYQAEALAAAWTSQQLTKYIRQQRYEKQLQSETVLKSVYHFDFLKKRLTSKYNERMLEAALMENIGAFLQELGYGFSFVARQGRIPKPTGGLFYVDWVFYHYLQQQFILIDLKMHPPRYQDIGQMDTYVRLFQQNQVQQQPTLGLLLCPQLDEELGQYTALATHPQLWAAQYII